MKATTQEERTLAALGHGLTFVDGGILLPFVLYLLQKDKSQFVAFHCLQSIYFGLLAAVVLLVIGTPLYVLTCGFGMILFLPLAIAYFVWEIIGIVKAYNGEWYLPADRRAAGRTRRTTRTRCCPPAPRRRAWRRRRRSYAS
jgi:uncharacterized membrane protein